MADYDSSIKLDPEYSLAYYRRGELFDKLGKKSEALNDYNNFLQYAAEEDEDFQKIKERVAELKF